MDPENKHIPVSFCCPWHGVLRTPVEYFNVDIGSKKLVDMSVKYCPKCDTYYTPFSSYLASKKIIYKGHHISTTISGTRRASSENVRMPYYIDADKYVPPKHPPKLDATEKYRKYIEGLRQVVYTDITITNTPSYIENNSCPICNVPTKKETIKVMDLKGRKYVLAKIRHCSHCNRDYISPAQFHDIHSKSRSLFSTFYCRFRNVSFERGDNCEYLFIPIWALDCDKYNHHKLPPKGDSLYQMTDEEYLWVKWYHEPEEFQVQLRAKSFLGEAGYSTTESEIKRHGILERSVKEFGKDRVIFQLKSNMNMRLRQKDGEIRYANALNVWRGDIWYVENKL